MAVLLVTSVRNRITEVINNTITNTGRVPNMPRLSAIHTASPEELIAAASDSPPPNSRRTPQGMTDALSQVMRNSRFFRFTGIMNMMIAEAMAITVSFNQGKVLDSTGWKIQAAAVSRNTTATSFSPRLMGPRSASC